MTGPGRRTAVRDGRRLDVDTSVPALTLKIGQYPLHSGGVGVLRSLGRLGVPVYAITEPGLLPAAASRYCAGRIIWRATGREDPDALIPALRAAGDQIGRRSVLIALDDEAAVLAAEHAAELSDRFILPAVAAGLPRKLASKTGLSELCREHGIPAPRSVTPASFAEAADLAAAAEFPVVVKNAEPWQRRRRPVVAGTTVVRSGAELRALIDRAAASGPAEPSPGLIIQEYLPPEHCADWVTHLYCDAGSACLLLASGIKVRSWPPGAGVTACGYSVVNRELMDLAAGFCRRIGYRGIADLDWRLDRRDGRYQLVDFNPRPGNQFRLFENEAGVDVVRAMHLDLTGRRVPRGRQAEGRRIVVEHADLPARLAYRMRGGAGRSATDGPPPAGRPAGWRRGQVATEYAWLAGDDPLPCAVMLWHAARPAGTELARRLRGLARRRRQSCR